MNKTRFAIAYFIFSFVHVGAGMLLGQWFGWQESAEHWQKDAVSHGAAEYITDEKGNVTWRWKE